MGSRHGFASWGPRSSMVDRMYVRSAVCHNHTCLYTWCTPRFAGSAENVDTLWWMIPDNPAIPKMVGVNVGIDSAVWAYWSTYHRRVSGKRCLNGRLFLSLCSIALPSQSHDLAISGLLIWSHYSMPASDAWRQLIVSALIHDKSNTLKCDHEAWHQSLRWVLGDWLT